MGNHWIGSVIETWDCLYPCLWFNGSSLFVIEPSHKGSWMAPEKQVYNVNPNLNKGSWSNILWHFLKCQIIQQSQWKMSFKIVTTHPFQGKCLEELLWLLILFLKIIDCFLKWLFFKDKQNVWHLFVKLNFS